MVRLAKAGDEKELKRLSAAFNGEGKPPWKQYGIVSGTTGRRWLWWMRKTVCWSALSACS